MHIDAIIKTSEDFFKKYTSHFIWKGCVCERELETEQNCNILTPNLMAISVVSFSFSSATQTEALGPLCWILAFSTASCHQRVSKLTDFLSSPSYIIVQSPTQYLPILAIGMCHFRCPWNGMFDCHRAEITVMQFTGHSLPAHKSMTVPRVFNPVPYCQPSSSTPMEYILPPSLEWHVWRGRRSI